MPKPGQKCITVPKRVFDELKEYADAKNTSIPKLIKRCFFFYKKLYEEKEA